MDLISELFQEYLLEASVTAVFIFIVVTIAVTYSRKAMVNMASSWTDVAQQHGLHYTTSPMSIDYGGITGTHTFELPGMQGQFRGYDTHIQSATGTDGREAGRYKFYATIRLHSSVPFSVLAYKRNFTDAVKQLDLKNTKVNYKPLDKAFKIRTENPEALKNIAQAVHIASGIQTHKLRTVHLIFDADQLLFEGAINTYSSDPQKAMNILNWLCDIAEAIDNQA